MIIYSVDATDVESLAKYVNDGVPGNCRMKKVVDDGTPYFCLSATTAINNGEELRYSYVNRNQSSDRLWWRDTVC